MRLMIAMRPEWSLTRMPIGLRVEVRPGLRFLIEPAQPVPINTRAWGDRIVFGALPPERVKVATVEDLTTEEGWPVTYVISDELAADGRPTERRIHAIVRLAQHAVVVIARSLEAGLIDEFEPQFRGRILSSRADFADEVASLAQVWEGLEVKDLSPPRDAVVSPTNE